MVYSIDQLIEIEEMVKKELPGKLEELITLANRQGRLENLLNTLNLSYILVDNEGKYETHKNGKIVVIGESDIKEKVMLGIAKKLNIDRERLEFCLGYDAAKKYNFRKLQFAPKYRVVLVGPMPHSVSGKGDHSSIITGIENTEGYPRIERLKSNNALKITKSNFEQSLRKLLIEDYI
jgi:hypothetical protein